MNRLRRWLPRANPTLEAGTAAAVGFLAGQALHGELGLIGQVLRLLFGH